MKKLLVISLVIVLVVKVFAQDNKDFVQYVNPLVGSDSKFRLSNGNTYPTIALPWGMNFWTPQTNRNGSGWIYQYNTQKIRGFRQTHQPSPWIKDYGAFSIFATTGKGVFGQSRRKSSFSHNTEISMPNYYKVTLDDYNTTVEITPTERAASFRFTYPETNKAFLIVDGFDNSYIEIFPEERKIIGYTRQNSGGVPDNFKNYFVIYVDKDFDKIYTVKSGRRNANNTKVKSKNAGCIIRFETEAGEQVNLKVASSFISYEQAELNLQREIGEKTFDQIRAEGKAIWNENLSRVAVEGGSESQLTTFYTALYRTLLFPRKFYEYNKDNQIVHYSPYNGKIEDGYMFTDNGFWDTFRAVFPFFTLMYPEMNSQIMQGLANTYRESGWLPEWASPGHRDCMIGSNSAINIADSYLKGIPSKDIETLYEAIIKNSNNEGPLKSLGRYGVEYYNELGYIPYDVKVKENTARTLEYAFADYNIWKLAQKMGKPQEEIDLFKKRALNYQNVFDTTINFMRGKNADGSFQSPFKPDKWGDAFTEGCSWHWTWSAFHDIDGLINLMGGDDNFVQKLDSVFTTAPTSDHSYYHYKIHEIVEMELGNMGQYAHGNQPIQHMPYLYNYAGEPWKTQYHVRNIMDKLYTPLPDGLCGDEDNGQTSAWYVFSAIGMYPVAPGTGEYVLGAPLFKRVTLILENGNSFIISAPENSKDNYYINHATFNNENYTKNYLKHSDIMRGGNLEFKMSATPNEKRGISATDFPYSMSKELKRNK
jgi:predicted alpha-1,2-mannosidase